MTRPDDPDPTDLGSQEYAKAARHKRDRVARRESGDEIRWLMRSKLGRRIVWRQLEEAGVFRSVFSTNAMAMAFAEGNRNAGLRTLGLIHEHCPELYLTMTKEHGRQADDSHSNPTD